MTLLVLKTARILCALALITSVVRMAVNLTAVDHHLTTRSALTSEGTTTTAVRHEKKKAKLPEKKSADKASTTDASLLSLLEEETAVIKTKLKTSKIVDGNHSAKTKKPVSTKTKPQQHMAQAAQECPSVGMDPQEISVPDDKQVKLGLSAEGTLCLLVLTDDSRNFLPVARSYDGKPWDRYVQLGKITLGAQLQSCDSNICTIMLPTPYTTRLKYKIVSYQHSIPEQDEIAAFLESATFGPTRKGIDEVMQLGSAGTLPVTKMATWIQQQQNETLTPPSYHRIMFRKHANAQFERSSKYGQVTHPCQKDTMYRRYAFSLRHKDKMLEITTVTHQDPETLMNDTLKILSIGDVVLTVVEEPVVVTDSKYGFDMHGRNDMDNLPETIKNATEELEDGVYEMCRDPQPGIGAPVQLMHPTMGCVFVAFGKYSGNPPVEFPHEDFLPSRIVHFEDETSLVPVDEDYFLAVYGPEKHIEGQILRAVEPLQGEVCESVKMASGYVKTVFGNLNGTMYIHDPRWQFLTNTVEEPASDGGGSIVNHTDGWQFLNFSEEQAVYQQGGGHAIPTSDLGLQFAHAARCANVERNFLNEDSCYMTSDEAACSVKHDLGQMLSPGEYGSGVLVCGSPGEVANDPSLGGMATLGAFDWVTPTEINDQTTDFETLLHQRTMVWTSLAVYAKDQLRQRVAWALFQLIPVNEVLSRNTQSEEWVNYYDIFVRNAFKNFRDVLKEVAFSRMMGEMLTYQYGKSQSFSWVSQPAGPTEKVCEFADENFAREIMQLFTIGLTELNSDGTPKQDADGNFIDTYSNHDVMELGRTWTGFWTAKRRGNSIAMNGNRIDPMDIVAHWRDPFPKMGLKNKYIGDGFPLCADVPKFDYLKKGAKYILLGYSPQTELGIQDPASWIADEDQVRFRAANESALYDLLCSPTDMNDTTSCSFPPVVTLPETIECEGDECLTEHVRTVNVREKVYYEYVRPPCVYQSFFPQPKKIKKRSWPRTYKSMFMCADPRTDIATAACCYDDGRSTSGLQNDTVWGERIKYDSALRRCTVMKQMTEAGKAKKRRVDICASNGTLTISKGIPLNSFPFYWFDVDCQLMVKISHEAKIAVVHHLPDEDYGGGMKSMMTDPDNLVFFRALWSDESNMTTLLENCATSSGCAPTEDGYCSCSVNAQESTAFETIPTREEVLQQLSVGAFDPDVLDLEYTSRTVSDVTIYQVRGTSALNMDTIFEVFDDFGVLQRRKNMIAMAHVGEGLGLSFRVPVSFMSLAEPTKRDALHETDAVLDHIVQHENTAPFVAIHFAQRFGISNPTPMYIKTISEAFRTGKYEHSDGSSPAVSYGTGKYGDLKATTAATLLADDARSVLLQKDPAQGSMKETIIKVISVMRQLEFATRPEYPFLRFKESMQARIGQMVYESPDIFSYFNPRSQPDGLVGKSGLVSPETRIHTTSVIMTLTNGLMSLVKYGFDSCYGGFGWPHKTGRGLVQCHKRKIGHYDSSSALLNYTPASTDTTAMVNELATLLTAGRLSSGGRQAVENAVRNEANSTVAFLKASQLILTSAEFHTTGGAMKKSDGDRPGGDTEEDVASEDYKAVVFINLKGGADTHQFIVPHLCSGDLRQQYDNIRGSLKLTEDERKFFINTMGQPCALFAINNNLPILSDLFSKGQLSWFMNVGVLNKNVTRHNYEALTQTRLFAHNTMQQEIQQIDPFDKAPRTGILGRAVKALNNNHGIAASAVSINKPAYAVNGDVRDDESPLPVIISEDGGESPFERPGSEEYDPTSDIFTVNGPNEPSSNMFGETWSELLSKAIFESGALTYALKSQKGESYKCGSKSLNMIAKVMDTRGIRRVKRDLFYADFGHWDHHRKQKIYFPQLMKEFNDALACFINLLKEKGLWEKVTIVVTSEFGRTLSPNSSRGSDHGWAGNYFIAGGGFAGGKVHGKYPSNLRQEAWDDMVLDRSRLIPTMSFESMWAPVLTWLGLDTQSDLDEVLPNWKDAGTPLISKADVFDSQENSVPLETVKYGSTNYLHQPGSKKWVYVPSPITPFLAGGDPSMTSDENTKSKFKWTIRSNDGSGANGSPNAQDSKQGQCVKYGDNVYLTTPGFYHPLWIGSGTYWLDIVRLENFVQNPPYKPIGWILASTMSSTDPERNKCIKLGDVVYMKREDYETRQDYVRWMTMGALSRHRTSTWYYTRTAYAKVAQYCDVNSHMVGEYPEEYYKWVFQKAE